MRGAKPQRSILRGGNLIELLPFHKREAATNDPCAAELSGRTRVRVLTDAENGENALRGSVPGERKCVPECWFSTVTVDCRRPLRTWPRSQEIAACRTFHLTGPPLEP